jgi:hypothetical protein
MRPSGGHLAVTTKLTVVAVDPPKLRVAAVSIPSTWYSPAVPLTCLLGRQRPLDHLPGQVREVLALTVQVPREVRLVAAEHPDVRLSHPTNSFHARGAGRPTLATAMKLHYN